jgi:hypothetical protein
MISETVTSDTFPVQHLKSHTKISGVLFIILPINHKDTLRALTVYEIYRVILRLYHYHIRGDSSFNSSTFYLLSVVDRQILKLLDA